MMFLLFLSTFITAILANQPGNSGHGHNLKYVKRVVNLMRNTSQPFGGVPEFLDYNHTEMRTLGAPNNVFTEADIQRMDQEALAFYIKDWGFDFSPSNPNVQCPATNPMLRIPGTCLLSNEHGPLALLFPGKEPLEDEIYVIADSAYPERGLHGGWQQFGFDNAVTFFQSGTIAPGATHAGQMYVSGSLLMMGITGFVKTNSTYGKNDIEIFDTYSTTIGSMSNPTFPDQGPQYHHWFVMISRQDGSRCEELEWSEDHYEWRSDLGINAGYTRFFADHIICGYNI